MDPVLIGGSGHQYHDGGPKLALYGHTHALPMAPDVALLRADPRLVLHNGSGICDDPDTSKLEALVPLIHATGPPVRFGLTNVEGSLNGTIPVIMEAEGVKSALVFALAALPRAFNAQALVIVLGDPAHVPYEDTAAKPYLLDGLKVIAVWP